MTNRNLKRFEATLLAERRRAVRALSQLNADLSSLTDDGRGLSLDLADSSDVAASEFGREVESVEAEAQLALLDEIDRALAVLHEQPTAFGQCELCGTPIASERLTLLPWTRRCRRHANSRRAALLTADVA